MYTDTKETTRQVNGQTVCCGSRLYINIFWKQLFHLSISTFQQQKLNDETVTLPNLRILSMPIKKKKTILCKTPSYKNWKNTYWISILIFFCFYSRFLCWKKNVTLGLTLVAIKLHIHEVSMGKKYGNGFLFALITRGCLWLGINVSKRSKLRSSAHAYHMNSFLQFSWVNERMWYTKCNSIFVRQY